MAKKKPDQKFLQMIVEDSVHRLLKSKSALAGLSMTEFVISAIENYTPEKK
jgi:predicted HicB family RNase H-like nuclease